MGCICSCRNCFAEFSPAELAVVLLFLQRLDNSPFQPGMTCPVLLQWICQAPLQTACLLLTNSSSCQLYLARSRFLCLPLLLLQPVNHDPVVVYRIRRHKPNSGICSTC